MENASLRKQAVSIKMVSAPPALLLSPINLLTGRALLITVLELIAQDVFNAALPSLSN